MYSPISENAGKRSTTLALLSLFCLSTMAGCLSVPTPPRFLVVAEGMSEYKAVTPDDARLWVRRFRDELAGSLDFWAEALRHDLVEERGYTLVEENTVATDAGGSARELLCEVTIGGIPRRYLIQVQVREGWRSNRILVAEYTAPKKTFDEQLEGVRASLRQLR